MTRKTYDLDGATINRMGFGAMQLPGPGVWGPPADRDEALAVLRRAVDLGINHIDTAQFYGPGVASELIREALAPYPEDLVIATKVGARRGEDRSWLPAPAPRELRADVEENLRTLGVERLDLVNLRVMEPAAAHEAVPFAESLGALADLQAAGKVGRIGLSNVTVAQLEAGLELADIAGVQNPYNVLERASEDVVEASARHGVAFTAFFPLGSAFTGGPGRMASEPAVRAVAERHEATATQVALAWLLAVGRHLLVIPGTRSVAHLEENARAAALELDAEDLATLDALAATPTP
jgi:pyridoxine 4-dehydrogenase